MSSVNYTHHIQGLLLSTCSSMESILFGLPAEAPEVENRQNVEEMT